MVKVKTLVARDRGFLAALSALMIDSRARLLIGLMEGEGMTAAARFACVGDSRARILADELISEGLAKSVWRGKIVLTGEGRLAALAAVAPLKSAVMAGISQDQAELF